MRRFNPRSGQRFHSARRQVRPAASSTAQNAKDRWTGGGGANALEFQHADFRRRSARHGKASRLAARGEDTMTGDDQRDRILGHRRSDVTRNLRTGANVLRQEGGRRPSLRVGKGDVGPKL